MRGIRKKMAIVRQKETTAIPFVAQKNCAVTGRGIGGIMQFLPGLHGRPRLFSLVSQMIEDERPDRREHVGDEHARVPEDHCQRRRSQEFQEADRVELQKVLALSQMKELDAHQQDRKCTAAGRMSREISRRSAPKNTKTAIRNTFQVTLERLAIWRASRQPLKRHLECVPDRGL